MGYRLGCPGCDAWTPIVLRAYEAGENCPYCGGVLNTLDEAEARWWRIMNNARQS